MYRTESPANYGTLAYGQRRASPHSNDGPCQMPATLGQWHMIFIAKKGIKNTTNYCPFLTVEKKEWGGSGVHLQPGRPIWRLPFPAGTEEMGTHPAVLTPAQSSHEAKLQEWTPEVHMPRLGQRCSAPVQCGGFSWWLSRCRCWHRSRLAVQNKSDMERSLFWLTLINGNRAHTLSLCWQETQLTEQWAAAVVCHLDF